MDQIDQFLDSDESWEDFSANTMGAAPAGVAAQAGPNAPPRDWADDFLDSDDSWEEFDARGVIENNMDVPFVSRMVTKNAPVRKNEDGSVSTHRMAWTEIDGRYAAFPTIDIGEDGQWIEPEDPLRHAMETGNIVYFDDPKRAEAFAAGSWKKTAKAAGGVPAQDMFEEFLDNDLDWDSHLVQKGWKKPPKPERPDLDLFSGRALKRLGQSVGVGLRDFFSGYRKIEEMMLHDDPEYQQRVRAAEAAGTVPIEETLPKEVDPGSSGMVEDAVVGMARYGPSMAVSAAIPPAGLASTMTQMFGEKYNDLSERHPKMDENTKVESALIHGALSGGAEYAGNIFQIGNLKRLAKATKINFKSLKELAKFAEEAAQRMVLGGIGEGSEEILQGHTELIADIYAENNGKMSAKEMADEYARVATTPEFAESLVAAETTGALGGVLLAGAGGAVKTGFDYHEYRKTRDKGKGESPGTEGEQPGPGEKKPKPDDEQKPEPPGGRKTPDDIQKEIDAAESDVEAVKPDRAAEAAKKRQQEIDKESDLERRTDELLGKSTFSKPVDKEKQAKEIEARSPEAQQKKANLRWVQAQAQEMRKKIDAATTDKDREFVEGELRKVRTAIDYKGDNVDWEAVAKEHGIEDAEETTKKAEPEPVDQEARAKYWKGVREKYGFEDEDVIDDLERMDEIIAEMKRKSAEEQQKEAAAPKVVTEAEGTEETTPKEKPKGFENQVHDYSSTQVNLPEKEAKAVRDMAAKIPDKELYEKKDDDSYGREDEPHVTVRYGLDTVNPEDVTPAFKGMGPITAKMGKVSIFETDEYDVVKVDIDSDELRDANKRVGDIVELPGETFKDYKPHATIAYVKKGEGKKYVGDASLEGREITFDSIVLSAKDGKNHEIKLDGAQQQKPTGKQELAPEKTEKEAGSPEAESKAKEPWKMSKADFLEAQRKAQGDLVFSPAVAEYSHKNVVKNAINSGKIKSHPDYPDLAPPQEAPGNTGTTAKGNEGEPKGKPTKAAQPKSEPSLPEDHKLIGKNASGDEIFEDQSGNRYYKETVGSTTTRQMAPVAVTPKGKQTGPKSPRELYDDGNRAYLTADEHKAFESHGKGDTKKTEAVEKQKESSPPPAEPKTEETTENAAAEYTPEELEGVEVEVEYAEAETGKKYRVKESAAEALAGIDEDIENLYKILECVS